MLRFLSDILPVRDRTQLVCIYKKTSKFNVIYFNVTNSFLKNVVVNNAFQTTHGELIAET